MLRWSPTRELMKLLVPSLLANPDASPAALARRPLGAGSLGGRNDAARTRKDHRIVATLSTLDWERGLA